MSQTVGYDVKTASYIMREYGNSVVKMVCEKAFKAGKMNTPEEFSEFFHQWQIELKAKEITVENSNP